MESFRKLCQESYLEDFQGILALAKEKLESKKRLAGDSFFDHNFRVAQILLENNSSPEMVKAALLQGIPLEEAPEEDIKRLLIGLSKLKDIKLKYKQLEPSALRKIILTTLEDVQVIIIKLANKIDNLRHITPLPQDEQRRVAEEVLEVYAPLAYRLGVDKIKNQLEDEAFRILNPRKYQEISNFLQESSEQREKTIQEIITTIKNLAKGKVNFVQIKGRSKHIYSIYKKIVGKDRNLKELYDLFGIRVIVREVKDCYLLLGLLHEQFESVKDRLKDYIANPKPNFYRSIHTAINLRNKIVEIQIRTEEMDEFAEEGVAAHWRYKKVKSQESFEKKMSWLKGILNLQKELQNKDFLESVKVDLFGDKIYCYTPQGDVKELPKDATLLDFAYLVHEHIGNKAVGGRVNGKFVPLKHKLKLGDVVEIITNKNQRPRRSWLKVVQSAKSRQKIRKSLKQIENLPALFYRQLKPLIREDQAILVYAEELPNVTCVLAKCCWALPGEPIVGLITKRRIVSVHRKDCRQALKEIERWVSVQWKQTFNQQIKFSILADSRSGLLADLLHTIATAGFEVKEAKAKLVNRDNVECIISIIPRDLNYLLTLVERIRKIKGFKKIYFE